MSFLAIAGFLLTFGSLYKVFEKADVTGWVAFVPILNVLGGLKLVRRSYWWALLFITPALPFALCVLSLMTAARFGKGLLFGLGMYFLPFIFLPMLAFSDAQYLPPARAA